MRILRSLGISLLLICFLFKVMHWPGANITALVGCLTIAASVVVQFLRKDRPLAAGEVLRPFGGLLLLVTSVMHMLNWPGGTLALYSSVLLVSATLLSERTHIDLPRLSDMRAPLLLLTGLALASGGFIFKVMHWPTAGIQLALGLACGVVWTLLPRRVVRAEA